MDNASIVLEMDYAPSSGNFPYAFSTVLTYRLSDKGLLTRLAVKNTSEQTMPAGLGLHPYFERSAETRVCFNAGSFWSPPTNGAEELECAIPEHLDYTEARALPDGSLDHSFNSFDGKATIQQNDRTITLICDAPILHVYAPQGESYFCLEPVSHLPGRFGVDQLLPGETMSIEMKISVS